jgi:hypothetical protein
LYPIGVDVFEPSSSEDFNTDAVAEFIGHVLASIPFDHKVGIFIRSRKEWVWGIPTLINRSDFFPSTTADDLSLRRAQRQLARQEKMQSIALKDLMKERGEKRKREIMEAIDDAEEARLQIEREERDARVRRAKKRKKEVLRQIKIEKLKAKLAALQQGEGEESSDDEDERLLKKLGLGDDDDGGVDFVKLGLGSSSGESESFLKGLGLGDDDDLGLGSSSGDEFYAAMMGTGRCVGCGARL